MIDFKKHESGDLKDLGSLQETITMLPNVLNTRFIAGEMGQHYAVQRDGEYYV